jgi:hypothetical protein
MMRLARPLLLVALFLHALMPVGWMPNPAGLGESAFIICAADGTIQHGRAPLQPDSTTHHDACIFAAAAAHASAPPQAAALAAPMLRAAALTFVPPAPAAPVSARFAPQSPRAPPTFS